MDLLGYRNLSWLITLEPVMYLADALLGFDEVLQKHEMPKGGLESHKVVTKE